MKKFQKNPEIAKIQATHDPAAVARFKEGVREDFERAKAQLSRTPAKVECTEEPQTK